MGDDGRMHPTPTMAGLAVTADAIAATSSKRAKVRLLADHLVGLDPPHLLLATRYFAGRVFAPGDPRTLNVGGAALFKALRELAGVDDAGLIAAYRRHGDAGDTTAEVLRSRPRRHRRRSTSSLSTRRSTPSPRPAARKLVMPP